MKANEAPEKLYIDSREHWHKSWTAFTTKAKGDDIEYIRKDALVEKAKKWMLTHTYMFQSMEEVDLYIEMFIKEMKGEEYDRQSTENT